MNIIDELRQIKTYMACERKYGVCFDWDSYDDPEDIPHVYDNDGKRLDVDWANISVSGNTYSVEVTTPTSRDSGLVFEISDGMSATELDKYGIRGLLYDMRAELEMEDDGCIGEYTIDYLR